MNETELTNLIETCLFKKDFSNVSGHWTNLQMMWHIDNSVKIPNATKLYTD